MILCCFHLGKPNHALHMAIVMMYIGAHHIGIAGIFCIHLFIQIKQRHAQIHHGLVFDRLTIAINQIAGSTELLGRIGVVGEIRPDDMRAVNIAADVLNQQLIKINIRGA